ncbi:MAG: triacylglycerol lipase [Moraxellaceae bacterium]|nr:triacylglycerol lipase [Pseudomonadales bacterium]MCP5174556.1 triacylglycerol lipase [Moraxellaceae bacterium]MCP5177166.1 triacylglycerol lipase [Moraxellaceae bacterium]HQV21665.1 triacylglycerol lipase [Agitococcus sp.]
MKKILSLTSMALATSLMMTAPTVQAGYTTTKYPTLLVHGILGFKNFWGADYFYQIPSTLQKDGGKVHVATVSAVGSNELRGEQLIKEMQDLKAIYGYSKFNLIGHSQGSPTSRYAAAVRPDLVASVTSVNGVNKGSRVADVVRKVAPAGTVTEAVFQTVANGLAGFLTFVYGTPNLDQNSINALNSLTTNGLTAFNKKYPAGVPSACGNGAASYNYVKNGVTHKVNYYSWGGTSVLTNVLDPLDAGIGLLSSAFLFSGEKSDGLVGECSQRLGTVIRSNYGANHLDAVNGFFGIVNLFESNPKTIYRAHANRLQAAGL